jgi:prevent-host-death family protein
MPGIQVRPSRDLRNNYADIVKLVEEHDRVIITNNGVEQLGLVNLEDLAKFDEFLHRQFIYDELQRSKAKMSEPNAIRHDADAVHAELDQILEAHGL